MGLIRLARLGIVLLLVAGSLLGRWWLEHAAPAGITLGVLLVGGAGLALLAARRRAASRRRQSG